jgi:hypothetical protein
MGSSYHGPNSDCYHCNGCGTHRPCDDCSADCCQTNMNEHRRLRRLENSFIDKVYSAKEYVYKECNSAIHYLDNNYGISILIINDNNKNYLEKSKDILESIKWKKEQIKREASKIKEDKSKKYEIQRIKNAHEEKMKLISNQFSEQMKKIENENSDVAIQEDEIKKKKQEKRELKTKKDEIENKYKANFENFKSEKKNLLIQEFNRKKNEIDLKYVDFENIEEPEFEYSEEEKNEKNNLLQNINEIKKFKKIIPNYQYIIYSFELSNYLS